MQKEMNVAHFSFQNVEGYKGLKHKVKATLHNLVGQTKGIGVT